MNRIDTICQALLRDGKINIEEALAIGSAVRFIAFSIRDEQRREFIRRYGTVAVEEAEKLCDKPE